MADPRLGGDPADRELFDLKAVPNHEWDLEGRFYLKAGWRIVERSDRVVILRRRIREMDGYTPPQGKYK